MKRYIAQAFDLSDDYCDCDESGVCVARDFARGYEAGYVAARLEASKEPFNYYECYGSNFFEGVSTAIQKLGEEEV